jgi:hypothetical protein
MVVENLQLYRQNKNPADQPNGLRDFLIIIYLSFAERTPLIAALKSSTVFSRQAVSVG